VCLNGGRGSVWRTRCCLLCGGGFVCFKGGNGHDEWWCIMMGGRVWFVVQRGWRCGFYYKVSVMEKVMVSLLTEGKKKYIRRVCSECVLVIREREVKKMEITMVIMSVMGRMMESFVCTMEMVFSVLFRYLSLLLEWSFFL